MKLNGCAVPKGPRRQNGSVARHEKAATTNKIGVWTQKATPTKRNDRVALKSRDDQNNSVTSQIDVQLRQAAPTKPNPG